MALSQTTKLRWAMPWLVLGCAIAALVIAFAPSLALVWNSWFESEEYSHGILMPVVGAYILWQRSDELRQLPARPHAAGILLVMVGLIAAVAGVYGATQALTQYACLLVLAALVLSTLGMVWLRALTFPLLLLALAIPLPAFLYNSLSLQLQLWSSDLGVALIRALGISVFQDGNVIDLGALKLQVAEACNGLRYLFPLVALSVIMAYLYQARIWWRLLLVVTAVPLAVAMNGARIGIIGYLVEHQGPAIAEGYVHDAQGWTMFMVCFAILLVLVWALERFRSTPRSLTQALAVPVRPAKETPASAAASTQMMAPALALALVVSAAAIAIAAPVRDELVPMRASFTQFALSFAGWNGEAHAIDGAQLRTLRLSDYLLADFVRADAAQAPVNLYVAWYDSQRQGQAAHSPRSCLPGDGWEITEFGQVRVASIGQVNRALIGKGDDARLVYYWFAQRGRTITNEYAVKGWLVIDGIVRGRTDGALVRAITPVQRGEGVAAAEARLQSFVHAAEPRLRPHLPD